MNRILSEIRRCDVVLRCGNELYVGLFYDEKIADSPIVIGKGKYDYNYYLMKVGELLHVPCIEHKILARELFYKLEIGDIVPPDFFHELAIVYLHLDKFKDRDDQDEFIENQNRDFGNQIYAFEKTHYQKVIRKIRRRKRLAEKQFEGDVVKLFVDEIKNLTEKYELNCRTYHNAVFKTDEFYLKTYEEMEEAFPGYTEALDRTLEIAHKCEVNIKTKSLREAAEGGNKNIPEQDTLAATDNFIPVYKPDTGETAFQFLSRLAWEGLERNYPKPIPKAYEERLEMELNTINKLGYVEYFLIVWDYINFARENDIPVGPGRGSGAGSLVAYCSGITQVDPMKYDLFFDRFINPERVSMPDFDVDFCYVRRQEVIDYVIRKYGVEHVAQIVTFGTMAARGAVRDVGRVMGIPYAQVDKIAKLIPRAIGMTLAKALILSKDLKNAYDKNYKYVPKC